jgi:hypothetical protein
VLLREVLILLSEEAPLRSVVIGVMMRISSRASVSEDVQKTLLQEEMVVSSRVQLASSTTVPDPH